METYNANEVQIQVPAGRPGRQDWEHRGRNGDEMSTPVALGIIAVAAIVFIAIFVFWLKMLINAIVRPMDNTQKILWVAVMLVIGWIGAIVYYFVVYRKGLPAAASQPAAPAPTANAPQSNGTSSSAQ
jgi:hypothetical protein